MAFQTVFKRYEFKYLLTADQKERVLDAMRPYMTLDQYGRTTIRNLYFDTDTYRLIRRSIEKPSSFKEKLRIRSYAKAQTDSTVFVEIKRKYQDLVYKRRVSLPYNVAVDWTTGVRHCGLDTQISREIDYFLDYYQTLRPAAFLSYDREAYFANDGSDFRVTFDENVQARDTDLSLCEPIGGNALLDADRVLMEIKCSGGIPLWMTAVLSRERIFKTPFSKYGTAYKQFIFDNHKEGKTNGKMVSGIV